MIATNSPAPDRAQIEAIVRQVLRDRLQGASPTYHQAPQHNGRASGGDSGSGGGANPLVVNLSARHVHVRQQDLEVLFGPGAKLTKLKDLYQDGEFASEQLLNIVGPRNRMIPNVRILGPTRDYSQLELSYTDGVFLGVDLPLRTSGDHAGTPGCILVGPHGALNMTQGVIRAERHVHMHPDDCAHFNVKDGDYMQLKIDGPCGLIFDRVKVRQNSKVKLEIHIDTDEGNACHLASATSMKLMKC